MHLDLPGRVGNTSLPISRPLLPVLDAIVNSIHAIEDVGRHPGVIKVHVLRDGQASLGLGPVAVSPLGFRVEDDGIGFNTENFNSFDTSDSTWKRTRGGKGVGRFLWLKAFRAVRVESWYLHDRQTRHRAFSFSLPDGIVDATDTLAQSHPSGTIVHLDGLNERLADACPKGLDAMAARVMDHCASYLLRQSCPQIWLVDVDGSQLCLNERFRSLGYLAGEQQVRVGDHDLLVRHLHVREAQAKHRFFFCAHDREVDTRPVTLPDLPRRLPDSTGTGTFVLASYVSGALLDDAVNPERTAFALAEHADQQQSLHSDPTLDDIVAACTEVVKTHLATQLEAKRIEKLAQIQSLVETTAPEYRVLLTHARSDLETIAADLPPDKLEGELHRVKYELERSTRAQAATILKDTRSFDEYTTMLEQLMGRINDVGKSELVKYVTHRRVVLQILSKALQLDAATQKYGLERAVHQIIFPLKSTSDDVDFTQQNLWIIDERLAYHRYLASDQRLATVPGQEGDVRPDLLIFGRPFAFGDGDPRAAVVVIEFKRPLRDDYTEHENPIAQVLDYVDRIRHNAARDRTGRPMPTTDSTPFYGYIVADLTSTLEKQARLAGFTRTPDGQGFFHYNPNYYAYVEVISYTKLLDDARKRNRAFFDRLCIGGSAQ